MKLPILKEGDVVEVMWQDAGTVRKDETWILLEDIDWSMEEMTLRAIQTIGYFLHKTANTLFLCQSYYSGKQVIGIFSIPINCIQVLEKK